MVQSLRLDQSYQVKNERTLSEAPENPYHMNNRSKMPAVLLGLLCIFTWLSACSPEPVEPIMETDLPTPTAHPMFNNSHSGDEGSTAKSNILPTPIITDLTPDERKTAPSAAVPVSVSAESNGTVPILLYHHVGTPTGETGDEYFVTPDAFREQISYLYANGYNAINFDTLMGAMDNNQSLPPKSVLITFDDGYVDNYENAFPVLKDAGFTATFFVITSHVDQKTLGYMSWEMLTEMVDAGMRVESHTHTHANLLKIEREAMVSEIESSLTALSAHVEYKPQYFSYPFGQYDDLVLDVLQELEIKAAVTAVSNNILTLEAPYEWGRIVIDQKVTLPDFIALLESGPMAAGAENELTIPTAKIVPTQTNIISATVYDDALSPNWDLANSQGVNFSRQDATQPQAGDYHLTATAFEPSAALRFTVREQDSTPYRRNETLGLRFWLYSPTIMTNDDLSLIVEGSNSQSYWIEGDVSANNADVLTFSGKREYELGFNQAVPPNTWVQVEILLDDLEYDPGYDDTPVEDALYEYLTSFYLQFEDEHVTTIFIDSVELLMFEPET